MIQLRVNVDLSKVRNVRREIRQGPPEMSAALDQAGQRLLTFIRR